MAEYEQVTARIKVDPDFLDIRTADTTLRMGDNNSVKIDLEDADRIELVLEGLIDTDEIAWPGRREDFEKLNPDADPDVAYALRGSLNVTGLSLEVIG